MTFRELLKEDRPILGLYVSSIDPGLIEIAADAGLDYVRIDMEHGLFGYDEVRELIRTATLSEMLVQVRVSSLNDITKLLDFGATAILVPDVNSVQSAKDAVSQVKYAPLGSRGFNNGPRFLKYSQTKFMEYLEQANREVLLGIQLESREAIEHIDEILAVDGVDMVSSGKGDLSQAYGLLGQNTHPLILEKESYIIRKGLEHNKIPTVLSINAERTRELYGLGVKMITIGSDMEIYAQGIRSCLKSHRS